MFYRYSRLFVQLIFNKSKFASFKCDFPTAGRLLPEEPEVSDLGGVQRESLQRPLLAV